MQSAIGRGPGRTESAREVAGFNNQASENSCKSCDLNTK